MPLIIAVKDPNRLTSSEVGRRIHAALVDAAPDGVRWVDLAQDVLDSLVADGILSTSLSTPDK